jgi:GT2 family glycosyltransferase
VSTIRQILLQAPGELLVVDQTEEHPPGVQDTLEKWHAEGAVNWIRMPEPSIPRAMNIALGRAKGTVILFLDDDIDPSDVLLAAHADAYRTDDVWAVAGQVLQPGEQPQAPTRADVLRPLGASLDFAFNSSEAAWICGGMAGNLSLRVGRALAVGGFDENFVGAAFRFETELCVRICRSGGRIRFEPKASVRHLRHPTGGTRSHGDHRKSMSPAHGVGDYYFALKQGMGPTVLRYVFTRPFRESCSRFHLRRPWWIPVKWAGEIAALAWALTLWIRGPRYIVARTP